MRRPILLLLVVLANFAVPARAGTVISGTFGGEVITSTGGSPGVFTQTFVGGGIDATNGTFTATSQATVDTNPPESVISDGTFTLIFATGTVKGTYSGTASGLASTTFTLDVEITGGTDAFMGAMGLLTLEGSFTKVSSHPAVEVISGSYAATLAVPEPNTLTQLSPAIAGGAFVLLHRRRRKATALLL